jgi:hypothetical protein
MGDIPGDALRVQERDRWSARGARVICHQAAVERLQGLQHPPRLPDPHKKPGGMFPL